MATITPVPFEVQFVDKLGNDSRVVDAARVSFGATRFESNHELNDKDVKLIHYLAREKHYSPFRHCMLVLRIKCPEFVARQMYKHCVGIEGSTAPVKDTAWNELSGRYRVLTEVYVPPVWHSQHASAKQCSADPLPELQQNSIREQVYTHHENTWKLYQDLLERGVAKEEARTILPLSFMTEFVWTASLQAVQNFVILRKDPHAQREIQLLAAEIERIATGEFPVAFSALMRG